MRLATFLHTFATASAFQCLPSSDVYKYNGLHYGQWSKVRIVDFYSSNPSAPSWHEARIVPRIAGLLMMEQLGYPDIQYVPATSVPQMYEFLEHGLADLALTLWPAKYEGNLRDRVLDAKCPKAKSGKCVERIGRTGYKARSSWYVPSNVTAVRTAPQAWGVLNSLFHPPVANALMKASELPVTDMCGFVDDNGDLIRPDETYVRRALPGASGIFNCTDGSWVLANSTCCPRVDERLGVCNHRPPCFAVVVDAPNFDIGLNEGLVAGLAASHPLSNDGLNFGGTPPNHTLFHNLSASPGVQIVYGDVEAAVSLAERRDQPILTYSWEPRDEIMRPGRFLRITMPDFYECDAADKSSRFISTQAETGISACGFPMEEVEKAASWKIRHIANDPLTHFVDAFEMTSYDAHDLIALHKRILQNVSIEIYNTSLDQYDYAACEWILANKAKWQPWVQTIDKDQDMLLMYCAIAFAVFSWVWVFVIEPNFLRCGADPNGEHACNGSNKGTTVFGLDIVGLCIRLSRERRARRQAKGRAQQADRGSVYTKGDETSFAQIRGPPTATPRGFHGVGSSAQVSLGQTHILAKKAKAVAHFYVVRLDSLPETLEVTVRAIDASALFGHDHSGFSDVEKGASVGAQAITLTLRPGQKMRQVCVHLNDVASFRGLVHLVAELTVHCQGGSVPAVASPVSRMRISIIDGGSFPNGFLPPSMAFSYYGAQPKASAAPAGALDPTHDGDLTQVGRSGRTSGWAVGAEPTTSVAASMSKSKWAIPSEEVAEEAEALEVFLKDAEEIGHHSWQPVYHYLREALNWCWKAPGFPVPKPVTFAMCQFIVKGITGFVVTWLYEEWINKGLMELQLERAISIAMLMCVCKLIEWRVQMIYSGRWDVQRKLQMLLIRKYLTLDEADLGALSNSKLLRQQGGNLEDTFRTAILETAVDLSSNCFLAAHYALSEFWGVCFAFSYITYKWMQTDVAGDQDLGYEIGVVIVAPCVLVFMLVLFCLRAAQTWELWKDKFLAKIRVESAVSFVLGSPNLVRSMELEHDAANQLYTQINGTLWADFNSWLYSFMTESRMNVVIDMMRYALWAAGPYLIDPRVVSNGPIFSYSELLALLLVLTNISSSLVALIRYLTQVFTSGSMVLEVAQLLNYRTRKQQLTQSIGVDSIDDAQGIDQVTAQDQRQSSRLPRKQAAIRWRRIKNSLNPNRATWLKIQRAAHVKAEVKRVVISNATTAYCCTVENVTLRRSGGSPIFEKLNLYERHGPNGELSRVKGAVLSAGRLIGVRVDCASLQALDVEYQLLKLLAGWEQPDSGIAHVLPTVHAQLINSLHFAGLLFCGSLHANLTYGGPPRNEEALWQLCHRCGMSSAAIGASYRPSWGAKQISGLYWSASLALRDANLILVVRALLLQPEVLLLHRVGDLWPETAQERLIEVVKAFLDGSIDRMISEAGLTEDVNATVGHTNARAAARFGFQAQRRTVVWAASDPLLVRALAMHGLRERAQVLTVEQRDRATVCAPADVFPQSVVSGVTAAPCTSDGVADGSRRGSLVSAAEGFEADSLLNCSISAIPEDEVALGLEDDHAILGDGDFGAVAQAAAAANLDQVLADADREMDLMLAAETEVVGAPEADEADEADPVPHVPRLSRLFVRASSQRQQNEKGGGAAGSSTCHEESTSRTSVPSNAASVISAASDAA